MYHVVCRMLVLLRFGLGVHIFVCEMRKFFHTFIWPVHIQTHMQGNGYARTPNYHIWLRALYFQPLSLRFLFESQFYLSFSFTQRTISKQWQCISRIWFNSMSAKLYNLNVQKFNWIIVIGMIGAEHTDHIVALPDNTHRTRGLNFNASTLNKLPDLNRADRILFLLFLLVYFCLFLIFKI